MMICKSGVVVSMYLASALQMSSILHLHVFPELKITF